MVTITGSNRIEGIAHDLFEVITRMCLTVPRGRRRGDDLKELEFYTLALLHERGTMIVGDIQRLLGVLPAQMSRIIRSLETRPGPMISCRINSTDKRKIDVRMTEAGEKALAAYEAARVHRIVQMLQDLSEDDQASLVHLLERVRGLIDPPR